jgi:hypothetical protein
MRVNFGANNSRIKCNPIYQALGKEMMRLTGEMDLV